MRIALLLMVVLAIGLSIFVIVSGGQEPAAGMALVADKPDTFAEREGAMFPDGPHWIIRGFRQQNPVSLFVLLSVILFSGYCTVQALRAFTTGQNLDRMPHVAAAGLLPLWVGVCLALSMLRLLPYYVGQPSYHHDWLGAIRVTLFTTLIAALLPAAIAISAQWRHNHRVNA